MNTDKSKYIKFGSIDNYTILNLDEVAHYIKQPSPHTPNGVLITFVFKSGYKTVQEFVFDGLEGAVFVEKAVHKYFDMEI